MSKTIWLGSLTLALAVLLGRPGWDRLSGILEAAQSPVSTLEGVYSPMQLQEGTSTFDSTCRACHEPSRFAGARFRERWAGRTAAELLKFLQNVEPMAIHGGYPPEHYVNITAYILGINGLSPGAHDLPTDTTALANITIEWNRAEQ